MAIERRTFIKMSLLGLGALAAKATGRVDAGSVTSVVAPTLDTARIPTVLEKGGVRMQGVPESVDPSVVDVAKGAFKSETGVAPHIFADPGGVLVGADFGYTGDGGPWGKNDKGWKTMYESKGSIQPFSSVTQEIVRWSGEAFQNLPEGGFGLYTGGQMTVEIGKAIIEMPSQGKGHIYIFAARGSYPDGKQDTDLNDTVKITAYRPGHLQLLMYQSRQESNLAFISEGQLLQMVGTAHTMGTNCGAEGCSKLTLVAYDRNTGATEILTHTQGRSLDISKAKENWGLFWSNFRPAA